MTREGAESAPALRREPLVGQGGRFAIEAGVIEAGVLDAGVLDAGVLDFHALAALQKAMSPRSFRAIIDTFMTNAPAQIEAITRLIATQRYQDTLWQAHSLKGTCGSLGASALHATLCDIESAIRTERPETLGSLAQMLVRQGGTTWGALCRNFDLAPPSLNATALLPEAGA